MAKLFYTTYINVDLAHHKIFRAYVCKGVIKMQIYINEQKKNCVNCRDQVLNIFL